MRRDPSTPPTVGQRAWLRVRPLLATPAKAVLRSVERLLHPWRRRTTMRRVRELAPVRDVLVLCYGNICRSPYAAAALAAAFARHRLDVRISQGGFFGPGRPANNRAREVALARGTDLARHESRLVTAQDGENADLILVMEPLHATTVVTQYGARPARVLLLGDLDSGPVSSRTIADPYGHPIPTFAATFDRIDRCAEGVALALAANGTNRLPT